MAYQTRTDRLAPVQSDRERFLARRLRVACLNQTHHLPVRPEPRAPWDEMGRRDARVEHHNARGVQYSRQAMRAALATGDARIVRETRTAIKAYYVACMTVALSDCPVERTANSTGDVLVTAHRESAEALVAAMDAQVTRSPSVWERFKKEAREAVDALCAALEHEPRFAEQPIRLTR